ncbi:MAG: SGNH/GDSL hydrolase family protein [bacterium]|nr:SGNH/GDSL hydrolase family protein [bacterium]
MVRARSFLLASISLLLIACQAIVQSGDRQNFFELRDGLERSRAVFEQTGKGRVAFLGGSITYNPGWRDQLCDWLRSRFPATEFEFVAAGIPSTGSTPGAFRIARDVFALGKVDLLFEEAAVNDSTNGRSNVEQVRAMEGIVRRARAHNPAIDIVLMHFVDPGKIARYDRGQVPAVIRNHERVANHYGLPSLNLALEVAERIGRGEFTWRDDFKNLHPSPFGQALYARAMQRMLAAAWPEGRSPSPRESALLPPPLDPFCYDRGRLLPPSAVAEADGFELVDRWQNEVGGGTRPGFVDVPMLVGTRPGASLRLPFHGSAVGVFVAAGPDAGVIEYRIDGGAWRRQDLFTRWSRGLHLPWLYVLAADLERGARQEHELELRIIEQQNDKSRGHACRIVHFAVNGA